MEPASIALTTLKIAAAKLSGAKILCILFFLEGAAMTRVYGGSGMEKGEG